MLCQCPLDILRPHLVSSAFPRIPMCGQGCLPGEKAIEMFTRHAPNTSHTPLSGSPSTPPKTWGAHGARYADGISLSSRGKWVQPEKERKRERVRGSSALFGVSACLRCLNPVAMTSATSSFIGLGSFTSKSLCRPIHLFGCGFTLAIGSHCDRGITLSLGSHVSLAFLLLFVICFFVVFSPFVTDSSTH